MTYGSPTRRTALGLAAAAVGTAAAPATAATASWVARENAKTGTRDWKIPPSAVASEDELAAYASHSRMLAGGTLRLYVRSRKGAWRATAYRIGYYAGRGGRQVWRSPSVAAVSQPRPTKNALGTVRCAWRSQVSIPTKGWQPGSYLIKVEAGGRATYVPLTIRSSSVSGKLVIVNATTTYQAYNRWGGASLYHGPTGTFAGRARAVSFERPYDKNGASIFTKYEIGPVQLAEQLGLDLAYMTSLDLERTRALAGARGVVSLGHDEYWSVPMRSEVTRAREAGTNVAFLGANACYWRVRISDGGRTVTCYKSASADPVRGASTTAMWRSSPRSRPENSLVGMLYEAFPARGPMVVHDPGFFLFAGTGARRGTSYRGLVGTEVDRVYPIAGTPANLRIVCSSPVTMGGGRRTVSHVTYYTRPSGAGVFAVGTMLWTMALRGPNAQHGVDERSVAFARRVTANLFRAMAAGRMGRAHPAKGNVSGFALSRSTGTGTGGRVG